MPSDWVRYGHNALECIILHNDGLEPSARLICTVGCFRRDYEDVSGLCNVTSGKSRLGQLWTVAFELLQTGDVLLKKKVILLRVIYVRLKSVICI